jgi:hypothetical protein
MSYFISSAVFTQARLRQWTANLDKDVKAKQPPIPPKPPKPPKRPPKPPRPPEPPPPKPPKPPSPPPKKKKNKKIKRGMWTVFLEWLDVPKDLSYMQNDIPN